MKKVLSVMLAALIILGLLTGCGQSGDEGQKTGDWTPVTVTDDLGREVTIEAEPQRPAVLIGSFAETWLLAGGTIGSTVTDSWEDFDLGLDETVKDLGSSKKISMELLFDAEADLVIASANTKAQVELKETLEKAGIPVLYFDVNGFEDYLRMLKVCTEITGRSDLYEENGTKVEEQIEAVKASAKAASEENGSPKVLLIRAAASGVHAKGSDDTVAGLILRDLYVTNIADGSDLTDNLSLEKIIEEDPDFIFIVQQGNDEEGTKQALNDTLTGNPAWAGLSAVKNEKVFYLDKSLYHFKPNARWGTAYEGLKEIIYGK